MTTTIQISDTTKQVLESLKKKEKNATYDMLIQRLIKKHSNAAKSMFGAIKGIKWKKQDRLELHEY